MSCDLSIVIPTLNEAGTLPALLGDLLKQQNIECEIFIADGGSTDETLAIAAEQNLTVIGSAVGRGRQMNATVDRASGECLLFLHADSRLVEPDLLSKALAHLRTEDRGKHRTAGHFPLRFDRQGYRHETAFRYMETKSGFNRRHCQNGDQGLLLHRDFFMTLGGFDETLPFFEDFRIAERIHETGQWITLPGTLTTSARRFETEGLRARFLLMGLIVTAEQSDIPEFVQQAPEIYEAQDATGHLLLTPYFRTFANIVRHRGLRGTWQGLRNIGRLSRLHWWQCFFFFDNLFNWQSRPVLRFYDRFVYPVTANPIGDLFSACLAWVVGMWVLRPYFRLREHRALNNRSPQNDCP